MPTNRMPSRCIAVAIGCTGKPTMPKAYSTPCVFKHLAIIVAPSISANSFLPYVIQRSPLSHGLCSLRVYGAFGPCADCPRGAQLFDVVPGEARLEKDLFR